MKKMLLIMLMLAGISLGAELKGKYAIVLQAGNETNEGRARAVHALLYATDLVEKGYEVVLIYDGAGTGWAKEFRKPANPFHGHYAKLIKLGIVEEICDYCADSFDVKNNLSEQQKKLLVGDYKGHPSLTKWIERGYQIVVL